MKVALLFYGQPRFVGNEDVIKSYKKDILDKYDTDVFCHTWWTDKGGEYDCSTWSKITNCPISSNTLDIIRETYSPIVLKYDEPRIFEFPPKVMLYVEKFTGKHPDGDYYNHKNYSNILSQLYSIQKVSEIFESHADKHSETKYDWIVLARYDTVLIDFPDLYKCNPNKFYLPNHHPKFPDVICTFGLKFLEWSKNVFYDVDCGREAFVYENIWHPSPEAFKFCSFMKRFSVHDLNPCSMNVSMIKE
jgi:hypothetical protein